MWQLQMDFTVFPNQVTSVWYRISQTPSQVCFYLSDALQINFMTYYIKAQYLYCLPPHNRHRDQKAAKNYIPCNIGTPYLTTPKQCMWRINVTSFLHCPLRRDQWLPHQNRQYITTLSHPYFMYKQTWRNLLIWGKKKQGVRIELLKGTSNWKAQRWRLQNPVWNANRVNAIF